MKRACQVFTVKSNGEVRRILARCMAAHKLVAEKSLRTRSNSGSSPLAHGGSCCLDAFGASLVQDRAGSVCGIDNSGQARVDY